MSGYDFAKIVIELSEKINTQRKHFRLIEQLEVRNHYFANIFHKKKWINDSELEEIKIFGDEIGKMLSSLIKSIKNSMD